MKPILNSVYSFRYAFKGIWSLLKTERNARIHLLATVVVIGGAIACKVSVWEWLWLLLAITLVWVAEAFNTCIEKIVDLISPGKNPLAGIIKDMAAGAVLITAAFALATGIIIFSRYIDY